jgi:uncharacterized membrane protein YkvA (DUF1232 family)
MPTWAYYALGIPLAVYVAVVVAFIVAGRREDARAVAGFVPDCVVLFSRLLRDDRLPRRHKVVVAALIPYLAMPFDLIPDFVPIAGQLDDAVIVALVLRRLVRTNPTLIREHWPGPPASLAFVLRLAGQRQADIANPS